jgi:signal transduction histidine kinase
MIPTNLINRIFTQGQNQLAPENGSGVGLSIVKLVCDLHLGTVSVTSDYGWTCFSIFIPNKRKA